MRLLLPYLRRHTRAFAATFALATAHQLLQLVEPQILRLIIDRYVLRAAEVPRADFIRGVLLLIALSVAVGLLWRLARTIQEYSVAVIARRIGAALYAQSVAHSLLLPFREHEHQRSGEILQKVDKARSDAEIGISEAVKAYLAALAIAVVTIYAYTVHWVLSATIVGLIVLLVTFILLVSRPIRVQQRQITLATAGRSGSATEMLRNLEIVKSLGIEEQEILRLTETNDRILKLEERKLRLVRMLSFAEGSAVTVARSALLVTTVWLAYRQVVTPGELVSIFFYAMSIFRPLMVIGPVAARIQESRATFDALDTVLREPAETKAADDGRLGRIQSIRMRDVTLRYQAADRDALRGIDLELRAGETVAFVGPSGAGKSSIVKLLVGLYPPTSGTLELNGIDSRSINVDVIRRRIALVTQDPFLFAGTVRENLLLVDPDAGDAQCLAAIELAAATEILVRGGRGLDTRIGESGLRLSGGERQRIAIARALMRNPEVIIFDEATSNLDSLTERTIAETIRNLSDSSRTTILIAHRLATVANASRIVVLEDGAITETGTHAELLANGGTYAAMWAEQSHLGE
ncbi:MAG: ABC transporter ATP-binding protein [Thermoanaerobaculia bacterium]